jgi:hypothetical protein
MHTYVQTVQSSTCSQVQSSLLRAPTTYYILNHSGSWLRKRALAAGGLGASPTPDLRGYLRGKKKKKKLPHLGGGEAPAGSPNPICIASLLLRKESK